MQNYDQISFLRLAPTAESMADMIASLLAFALVKQTYSVPASIRGSRLYSQCRAAIRVDDGIATGNDRAESNSCVSYIDGFTDGLEVAGNEAVCADGTALGSIVRVYIAYMDQHPEKMGETRSLGLVEALLKKYRCPTSKKQ